MDAIRAHEQALVADALGSALVGCPGLGRSGAGCRPPTAARSCRSRLEGAHPHDIADILGALGVCVRAGHHCAQPLMRSLGVHATTRASFAVHNSIDDVDRLIEGLGVVRSTLQLD